MKQMRSLILAAIFIPAMLYDEGVVAQTKPNIIFLMADDLGWGDVGFNGNPFIKTPSLDEMAANGIQFNRFYAAAPVCSPTRGSCLTGRNAERYGIYFANVGHLPSKEITLAEVLREENYLTGHFGKWHLGTLSRTIRDGHRGGKDGESANYSPPWENGFDVCFSTEQAVPTWDPMKDQTIPTKYWEGPDKYARKNLEGDDSRVIMDRAIPFIRGAVRKKTPFFAVVWFHAPHTPVVAGPEYLSMYKDFDEDRRHYYGCITAMDEQIGRLRRELRELGAEQNTIIFFVSDNGPAGEDGGIVQHAGKRQQGSAGLFRGRKGSLYEGGIRVPALLEWPGKISRHVKVDVPFSTSDFFPTMLAVAGLSQTKGVPPLDGTNMLNAGGASVVERSKPLAFKSYKQRSYIEGQYKIYSDDDGNSYALYDLLNDPGEAKDVSASNTELVRSMSSALEHWIASCKRSEAGSDY
jgi:arylsulfatase A-like enzyme